MIHNEVAGKNDLNTKVHKKLKDQKVQTAKSNTRTQLIKVQEEFKIYQWQKQIKLEKVDHLQCINASVND